MKLIVILVLAVLSLCFPVSPNWAANELAEDSVFGDWVLPENGSVIRTYGCGKALCVKIVKVLDEKRRDIRNPDPALRKRPLTGIVIAQNFRKHSPAKWRGRLYNTLDGITYEGTLNLLDKNKITMVGCVFEGLFCEAKTFYRVNTKLPGNGGVQRNASTSSDRVAIVRPPLPVRKPAQIRISSLRDLFRRFLDSRLAGTSRTFTKKERDALFQRFMAWLKRQPAESRNKINKLLEQ